MGRTPRPVDAPLGTGVLGLFIAGLAGLPAYLGLVHRHHGGSSLVFGIAAVLSLAMLGSAFLTTGKVRERDVTYGRVFLAAFALTLALFTVLAVLAFVKDTTLGSAFTIGLSFLVAPALGAVALVVERTTGR